MEIERKFLVTGPPDLEGTDRVELQQGYLALADEDGGAEVRLRRKDDELLLTVKAGTGRTRVEEEIALEREPFESLWPLTAGRRVTKTRHLIPYGELEIELDVYSGGLKGLIVAEVEFPDEAKADAFEAPGWFGVEVTGNTDYLNETLATKGLARLTAFKLKKKESEDEGIRRVAHGRAQDAVELLRDDQADPVQAVHEARKDMKKLRATLKLVRPALGDSVYRRENRRFRDAGRALSDVRDAQTRAETLDALAERFADEEPPGGWWAVRGLLADDGAPGDGDLESLRDQTASEIARGDQAIEDWPLDADGFDLLRPGLKHAYARGRKSFRQALNSPSDEALHEWRKRSKDLWYHLRLVRRAWPELMETTAEEAHELSDRLGDDHDLVVLVGYLDESDDPLTSDQLEHLRRLIAKRREELQTEAFAYGERLYAEKPKRFVGRLESYWQATKL